MLQHLTKYEYVLQKDVEKEHSVFPIPYIWLCWLQGASAMPELVRACVRSVQKHHPQHKIKLLDYTNIQNFITIPEHILHKHDTGVIGYAHFCDYVRVALLAKYGGTWIDSTVFLTHTLPNDVFNEDFFAYTFPPWCNLTVVPSLEVVFSDSTKEQDRKIFSNWLLHAKPNNRCVVLLKLFLEEYWAHEDRAFDYYMFHLFATYMVLQDSICAKIFKDMLKINNAYAHLMQQCQNRPIDLQLYEEITGLSPVHKLSYKITPQVLPHSFASAIAHGV